MLLLFSVNVTELAWQKLSHTQFSLAFAHWTSVCMLLSLNWIELLPPFTDPTRKWHSVKYKTRLNSPLGEYICIQISMCIWFQIERNGFSAFPFQSLFPLFESGIASDFIEMEYFCLSYSFDFGSRTLDVKKHEMAIIFRSVKTKKEHG